MLAGLFGLFGLSCLMVTCISELYFREAVVDRDMAVLLAKNKDPCRLQPWSFGLSTSWPSPWPNRSALNPRNPANYALALPLMKRQTLRPGKRSLLG